MTRRRTLRAIVLPVACVLSAAACLGQQYVISTVAGGSPPPTPAGASSTSVGAPQYLAIDSNNSVFFTAGHCVYKLTTDGFLTRIAGNSRPGFSGDGGSALSAQLWSPLGLAVDSAGNVFVADSANNRIRRIAANGIITTVAGTGVAGFSGDAGPAVSAQLSAAAGVALDANGNLFIADSGNNRVRKVTPAGVITTIAGNGKSTYAGDGGPALSAQFSATSIAIDSFGNLYLGDTANYRIRKILTDGSITTVAGSGFPGNTGDGGSALAAQLSAFRQITVDSNGNIYVADTGNSIIREVTSGSQVITTVAGNGQPGFVGDTFSATIAALAFPSGIVLDSKGDILIADSANFRIRLVTTDGTISSVVGTGNASYSGDGRLPLAAQFLSPQGLALDTAGNLYVGDSGNFRLRKIPASGNVSTIAGNGLGGFSGDNYVATTVRVSNIPGIATTTSGSVFFADSGNYRVRQIFEGSISTVAGNGSATADGDGGPATAAGLSVSSIAMDSAANIYIGDPLNYRVRKVLNDGTINTVAGTGVQGFSGDNGPALNAKLSTVAGVAIDAAGAIYVVDAGNQRVRKIATSGIITTIAGTGVAGFSGDGGLAVNAQLHDPTAIAVDTSGNLYIADTGNNRIRKVASNGTITTIAGNGAAGYSGDGAVGTAASLAAPVGLAIGKSGTIYVADTGNNAIRLLTPATQSMLITAVVDAGSETPTPLSPGKIAVIYGVGLGPDQLVVNQPVNGVFGATLAGTAVSFRGILAPIYYTSATQVAAIVPYEISGSTSVPVVVSYQSGLSAAFNATFSDTSPGFFTANASGAGQLAAINVADGTLNSAVNPVKIGQYISLYATGEGQTTPAGSNGRLAPLVLPIPAPIAKVTATVDGLDAKVLYAGAVPGTVAGLMQVNVQIPDKVKPGGYVPVVLSVGNTSTVNGAVWIAVSN